MKHRWPSSRAIGVALVLILSLALAISCGGGGGGGSSAAADPDLLASGTIGAAGGSLSVSSSTSEYYRTALTVPASALTANVVFTIRRVAASVATTIGATNTVVDMGPSGTQFALPATVRLPYSTTGVTDASLLGIAMYDSASQAWQVATSTVIDTQTRTVSGAVTHFSYIGVRARTYNVTEDRIARLISEAYQFKAMLGADDISASATWTSSRPAIARVENASDGTPGRAVCLTEGITDITATYTTTGGTVLTDTSEYVCSPSTFDVVPSSETKLLGETQQFEAFRDEIEVTSSLNVSWSSSNPAVATVDSTGLANCISAGNTEIEGSYDDGIFSASDSGTLTCVAQTFEVTPASASKLVGQSQVFVAKLDNLNVSDDPNTDWSSSNQAVATINATGTATCIAEGTSNIKAEHGVGNHTYSDTSPLTCTVETPKTCKCGDTGVTFEVITYTPGMGWDDCGTKYACFSLAYFIYGNDQYVIPNNTNLAYPGDPNKCTQKIICP